MKRKTNEILFKKDYATIIITPPNKEPFECLVDIDDIVMLKHFYWYLKYDKRHPNCAGYIESRINGKRIFMHRFVMPAPIKKVVDHINGNPFDNRKSNLRICDQSVNCRNRNDAKNIYFNKRDNLYYVAFSINKKPKYLCYTRDYKEAEQFAALGRKLLKENKIEELQKMPCKCLLHSYHLQNNV